MEWRRQEAIDACADGAQEEIARLEARMDDLGDRIESCRKAMFASRVAASLSIAILAATLFGAIRSTPILLLAIAGAMGGLVGLGTNRSTGEIARNELTQCKAARDALIDGLRMRSL